MARLYYVSSEGAGIRMTGPKLPRVLVSAALTGLLVLTGCSTTHGDKGDPGTVTDRDEDHWTTRSGKTTVHHWDYDLTVRRPDGTEYEIDVSEDVYDHCYRGSHYPACAKR